LAGAILSAILDESRSKSRRFGRCVVPQLPHMNDLPSTWAFKIKWFPDGTVKKFKVHFCACGDQQKEGINFFETWAPVVQWSTM
jgi:hypothetical protein